MLSDMTAAVESQWLSIQSCDLLLLPLLLLLTFTISIGHIAHVSHSKVYEAG